MSRPPEQETPNFIAPVEARRGTVFTVAALLWMGVVFGSYIYINFDQVWSKVTEILGLR